MIPKFEDIIQFNDTNAYFNIDVEVLNSEYLISKDYPIVYSFYDEHNNVRKSYYKSNKI